MNNTDNYIATSTIYPEWLILFSEIMTFFVCLWLVYEGMKLCLFFFGDGQCVSKLLTQEFLTDSLTALLTMIMGLFLFLDFKEGVKGLVIIRPWIILLNVIAFRRLYNHYKRIGKGK